MKIIELKDVSKNYDLHPAVKDFSLTIEKGERIAILGHSGCGKTTVLRLLAGFIAPDSGSISIDGEVMARDGQIIKEPENRGLGMVFQDLALWPHLTVGGNLDFGLKAKGIPAEKRKRHIQDMLEMTRMEEFIHARPAELSGGQQQRVALARALVLHPEALLMDEPLSHLDRELNIQLRSEILRVHRELGFSLIYVTHDREEAYEIATRVVVLQDGRIRFVGSTDEARAFGLSVHDPGSRSAEA